ncbi:MAG TPA: hypothetical protein EYP58_05265 [bacterium (Candidatus Stahlbacteria)]|nr:hypothetical protein [Candidatus Stahlbacteria bacterium]
MAIIDWRSGEVLNPFFRLEGNIHFSEKNLALEFTVLPTKEQMVITLSPEEIKDLSRTLDAFVKGMIEDIEQLEGGAPPPG